MFLMLRIINRWEMREGISSNAQDPSDGNGAAKKDFTLSADMQIPKSQDFTLSADMQVPKSQDFTLSADMQVPKSEDFTLSADMQIPKSEEFALSADMRIPKSEDFSRLLVFFTNNFSNRLLYKSLI